MKKLIFVLCLAAIFPARLSWAQLAAPNDAGVAMGHIHLVVRDLDAYKKFWLAMGGTPGELGANLSFKFPGVLIFVRKGEPSGGTVGKGSPRAAPWDRWSIISDSKCRTRRRRWLGGIPRA